MLKNILLVGLGSSIGGILRYLFSLIIKSNTFPFATFTVNILGSFCIGIIFAIAQKENSLSNELKLFLATGICGGFTTFSTFSAENMQLFKQGNYTTAFIFILLSISLSIIATFIGFKIINS